MTNNELSELEENTVKLVSKEKLVYQSELPELIGCSTGYASKIARKLSNMDLIIREKEDSETGRNKIVLKSTKKDPEELNFNLLMAGDMLSPFVGEDKVDIQSDRFTEWLMNLSREHQKNK